MEAILIITNLPNRKLAAALAQRLIAEHLAACVNIMSPCTSVYHWQGKVENTEETPVFIKTLQRHYGGVERIIKECHPYELPEVIAVAITGGLPAYLEWIATETQ
jgi:periplasmic divalent cation tolerance protein